MTSYDRLSFTNGDEKKLIAFIEEHPALWDSSCEEYGNTKLRMQYWGVIARHLNKPEVECRRKWRFIRDYYLHKRKRCFGADKSDSKYLNLMFLKKLPVRQLHRFKQAKDVMFDCRNEDYSKDDHHTTDIEALEESMQCISEADLDSIEVSSANVDKIELRRESIDESNIFETILVDEQQTVCRVVESEKDVSEAYAVSTCNSNDTNNVAVTSVTSPPTYPSPSPPTCSAAAAQDQIIDLFFASMAATVKTFPPHLVAQAKLKIFNAVSELEFQLHHVDVNN